MDFYGVKITKLPFLEDDASATSSQLTEAQLLDYVRKHLIDESKFIDLTASKFTPYREPRDRTSWLSNDPVSTVLNIEIFENSGAVVCAESTEQHWRFMTVDTGLFTLPMSHPVSGTREFGIQDGVFYTRGADRPEGILEDFFEDKTFAGADRLWRSLQEKLTTWIEEHDGEAKVVPPEVRHVKWDDALLRSKSVLGADGGSIDL